MLLKIPGLQFPIYLDKHFLLYFFQEFIIMEAIESSLKSENNEFELALLIDKTSDIEGIHNSEKKNSTK